LLYALHFFKGVLYFFQTEASLPLSSKAFETLSRRSFPSPTPSYVQLD
jgi:hypothetical protein